MFFTISVCEVSQCHHQGAVRRRSRYALGIWVPEEGVRSGRGIKEGRGSDRSASEVVSGAVEVSGRTEYYPRYAVYLARCINVSL